MRKKYCKKGVWYDDKKRRLPTELEKCRVKVKYDSINDAAAVIVNMEASGAEGLNPYLCKYCAGWHIGHRGEGRRYGPL